MTTHIRRTLLSLAAASAVVAATSVGCGSSNNSADGSPMGTGGAGGSTQNCGDPNIALDPTALIDDMEAGSSISKLGNGSGWWAGGDDASKAAGATITPDGIATPENILGGRCDSKKAIHVTGQGFGLWAVVNVSMGWGAVDGGAESLLPYDASIRSGLTFWARVGDTSTNQVRLNISDQYSNDMGHICDPAVATGATACYDHFGTSLTGLGTTWRQYKIPFGGLKQLQFGIPRAGVDTAHLYSIDFLFPVGSVFDFWVDDISWY